MKKTQDLPSGQPPKNLVGILEKLPADDAATGAKLCEELAAGGSTTVHTLVALVGDEFGDPKGVKPKYALHGLVVHASRPGADGQRKVVAETLAAELDAKHSDELRAFVIRQLQLCGRDEEVPALAKQLGSDRLCEPATQALLAIGGKPSLKALQAALPDAKDNRKATISQAVELLSRK